MKFSFLYKNFTVRSYRVLCVRQSRDWEMKRILEERYYYTNVPRAVLNNYYKYGFNFFKDFLIKNVDSKDLFYSKYPTFSDYVILDENGEVKTLDGYTISNFLSNIIKKDVREKRVHLLGFDSEDVEGYKIVEKERENELQSKFSFLGVLKKKFTVYKGSGNAYMKIGRGRKDGVCIFTTYSYFVKKTDIFFGNFEDCVIKIFENDKKVYFIFKDDFFLKDEVYKRKMVSKMFKMVKNMLCKKILT